MEAFIGIITALFAIGSIAEKDMDRSKTLACCFCVSMAALAAICIL